MRTPYTCGLNIGVLRRVGIKKAQRERHSTRRPGAPNAAVARWRIIAFEGRDRFVAFVPAPLLPVPSPSASAPTRVSPCRDGRMLTTRVLPWQAFSARDEAGSPLREGARPLALSPIE